MIDIRLSRVTNNWEEKTFPSCKIYFAGYIQTRVASREKEAAIDHIYEKIKLYESNSLFEKVFRELSGSWALILVYKNKVVLSSDIIRSIPIFYSLKEQTLYVSDNSSCLVDFLGLGDLIKENIPSYLERFAAPNGVTILKNLYDVGAGSFVVFENNNLNKYRYWSQPAKLNEESLDQLLGKANDVFKFVFDRMKQYFSKHEDKVILLPLSGGMDSRLLAWALKKYNIKNKIVAFTYGVDESVEEARISKRLAREMGFEWTFVLYTKEEWNSVRLELPSILSFVSVHKSIVHLQDFIAIKNITKKYKNAIVLPGLCFDVLAGLTIPDELKFKNLIDVDKIIKTNRLYESRLSNFEDVVKNQRLSSFIVNSVRTYEYFGLKYYLPYWDTELVNFWYSIPVKFRIERNLFRMFLNKYAYVEEFQYLQNIPIALNRRTDSEFIKLSITTKVRILFKFYLRRLGVIKYAKRLLKKSEREKRIKNDYVGFYNLFKREDFSFDFYQKNYHHLVGRFCLEKYLKLDLEKLLSKK